MTLPEPNAGRPGVVDRSTSYRVAEPAVTSRTSGTPGVLAALEYSATLRTPVVPPSTGASLVGVTVTSNVRVVTRWLSVPFSYE